MTSALAITPMPASMPRVLAVCTALSIGIHLLLLTGLPQGSDTPQSAVPPASAAPVSIRARVIEGNPPPVAAVPQAAPRPPEVLPAPKHAPTRQDSRPGSPAASGSGNGNAGSPETNASTEQARPNEFDAYLPRRLLTKPPVAQTEIVIPSPPEPSALGRRVGTLILFIDEEGRVRQVAPDDLMLPPDLEQAARDAFMAGRFSPGEVGGQPAKSRIRVEVVFD